jgi:hypothetical protein
MSEAQPQSVGTYLYCVAHSQPFQGNGTGFQATGIDGRPVRLIRQGDLVAVVSDSLADQYDITRDNVSAHEGVIEAVMKQSDVLPVSFGTVASSDEDVRDRLLRQESDRLHQQLEQVKNQIELGVKVLWEQDPLFAQIIAEDSTIQELRDQIVGTTPEQTYDIRVQLGELVNAAIERKREQESTAILNALSPLAVDTRVNDIVTDMMILNASFLVDRNQTQAFESKVNELQRSSQGRLMFQFAGPLPPYNFVNIAMHWEEPSGAITQ